MVQRLCDVVTEVIEASEDLGTLGVLVPVFLDNDEGLYHYLGVRASACESGATGSICHSVTLCSQMADFRTGSCFQHPDLESVYLCLRTTARDRFRIARSKKRLSAH